MFNDIYDINSANTPVVTNDDFVSFLYWLLNEKEYCSGSIINVVDKPYKYCLEYRQFKNIDVEIIEEEL